MKRKLIALLLVLLLAVTLAVPALAAGDWVTDEAGLLTDQQISQLSQRAAALAHSSGVGVYIRTTMPTTALPTWRRRPTRSTTTTRSASVTGATVCSCC